MDFLIRYFLGVIIFVCLGMPLAFGAGFEGADLTAQPKVVELSPTNGTSIVANAVKELKIKFNVDMNTKAFSVLTPCGDSGICYKNGFWRDNRTFIIRVNPTLKANHKYELGIGAKSPMYSADGLHLEPVWWRFDTL